MQPLGLTTPQYRAYMATLLGSHNFTVTADVLTIAGRPVRAITETLLDGQINIQREGPVRRTCTLTFFDPDRRLQFDSDSPFESTLFLDRMVRVRHIVRVPGVGLVAATPFVGPVTTVSRDGDTLSVELQDKAALVARGRTPMTIKKGTNAVAAIRRIMTATGERQFRLPDANKRRTTKPYSVGWPDEASPWVVCEKIARSINLRLGYSCDGYLTLRPLPNTPSVSLDERHLTVPLKTTFDATKVVNAVRIVGTKKPKKKAKSAKNTSVKDEKIAVVAIARPTHPLSPARLGRNGEGRFLPLMITGQGYPKQADAEKDANRRLRDGLASATSVVSISCLPLFHLDNDDLLRVETDTTVVRMRLNEGSIPLGVGGDMAVGSQRQVSVKGRRRG